MRDLTGQVFGRLTVIRHSRTDRYFLPGDKYHRTRQYWRCRCSCGVEKELDANNLKSSTRSCGCLSIDITIQRSTTHGMDGTPIYKTWSAMKERCHNPNAKSYPRYGGRGITVCDRWRESFENFLEDMGPRPEECTIDRIDTDRGYYKENCKWSTSKEQSRNKSTSRKITFDGETKNVVDWAKDLNITRQGLRYRLSVMPIEKALVYKSND